MEKVYLSEVEKIILKTLSTSQYSCDDDMFGDLSREELYVGSKKLKEYGFIVAHYFEGGILFAAKILDKGLVYLKENLTLENPIEENDLKRLQKEEMEYKRRIRRQEDVIRHWKLLNIGVAVIGFIGWLLFVFNR
jgi:hypothetical protein